MGRHPCRKSCTRPEGTCFWLRSQVPHPLHQLLFLIHPCLREHPLAQARAHTCTQAQTGAYTQQKDIVSICFTRTRQNNPRKLSKLLSMHTHKYALRHSRAARHPCVGIPFRRRKRCLCPSRDTSKISQKATRAGRMQTPWHATTHMQVGEG